jgi:hypothetical protein
MGERALRRVDRINCDCSECTIGETSRPFNHISNGERLLLVQGVLADATGQNLRHEASLTVAVRCYDDTTDEHGNGYSFSVAVPAGEIDKIVLTQYEPDLYR